MFAQLRAQREEIYFLKNRWECNFFVFPSTKQPLVIQVTERLDSDNLNREIKGLGMARKRIRNSKGLLLADGPELRDLVR